MKTFVFTVATIVALALAGCGPATGHRSKNTDPNKVTDGVPTNATPDPAQQVTPTDDPGVVDNEPVTAQDPQRYEPLKYHEGTWILKKVKDGDEFKSVQGYQPMIFEVDEEHDCFSITGEGSLYAAPINSYPLPYQIGNPLVITSPNGTVDMFEANTEQFKWTSVWESSAGEAVTSIAIYERNEN